MERKRLLMVIFAVVLLTSSSCISISLTGSSVHKDAKTVSIATFPNNATLINPSLSQDFTIALRNKIQSQTPLNLVNYNGDYEIEGEIINYTNASVAIQGNDIAAMNRLTITVKVRFVNKLNENENFDQTFSNYVDYSTNENFTAIENNLVKDITDALTDQIFNKAFVNW